MKIMTFNTQHMADYYGDNQVNFQKYADYILSEAPDVVGLNEIRSSGEAADYRNQTAHLAALTQMPFCYFAKAISFSERGPYGNAMLSKLAIVEVKTVPIPDPDPKLYDDYYETRCLLKAKLENGVTVLISHFGLNPDEHENAAKTIAEHIEAEKCILMGDFNVPPDSHILDPIRARMKDTADVFPEPLLSFPADAPVRMIDYIFVSPDIQVVSADIPALELSDHRPYIAELIIPEDGK